MDELTIAQLVIVLIVDPVRLTGIDANPPGPSRADFAFDLRGRISAAGVWLLVLEWTTRVGIDCGRDN
jgi:hypothetical protein